MIVSNSGRSLSSMSSRLVKRSLVMNGMSLRPSTGAMKGLPRCDQKALGFEANISHLNGVAINEPRRPLECADAIADNALILLVPVIGDDFVLLADELRKVEAKPRRFDSWIARIGGVVDDAGRRNQVFRRQTSPVHAGAAERAVLSHRGRFAEFGGSDGCCKRGRS